MSTKKEMKGKQALQIGATLRSPSFIGGAIVGAVLLVVLGFGFNAAVEATTTESFCLSCHEMRINYQEYADSIHDKNYTGIVTTCSDCHVPKEWGPKLLRKLQASREVYHWLIGTIDTPDKFNARRAHMAESVWEYMKSSDSRECRNCHDFDSMDLDAQDKSARKKHLRAVESGETCIDCHQGIAHELPDEEI